MIEKAFLPVRLANSTLQQFLANDIAQRLHPGCQSDAVRRKGDKQVNVIGHYNIPTDSDIVFFRLCGKSAKSLMDFIVCEQALTSVCVEGHEVERANIVKQATEPGRASRPLFCIRA